MKVRPATVRVPVRDFLSEFFAAIQLTAPLPRPVVAEVIESHSALEAAVQLHPAWVVTMIVLSSFMSAFTFSDVGEIEYVHGDGVGVGVGDGVGDGDGDGVGVGDGEGVGAGVGVGDGSGASAAACVTTSDWSAIAIAPVRCPPVFAETLKRIVLLPVALAPAVTAIHAAFEDAVQWHSAPMVTVTPAMPPGGFIDTEAGSSTG